MAIDNDIHFIVSTPIGAASSWDYSAVTEMAGRSVPENFLGDHLTILRGDQHRLWLRWFLEGLVSPLAMARSGPPRRLDVFEAVHKRIEVLYPEVPAPRVRDLTDKLTDHLYEDVQRHHANLRRDHADKLTKVALLEERDPPRCYICGFAFSKAAQDALLRKKGREEVTKPKLVDVFRPRLHSRDISIEIEHVVPVAHHGHGTDNLRLACGWCNKYKSSKISLYEASQMPSKVRGFKMGDVEIHELPHPFWMIRVLALTRKCNHREGCDHTADTAEMFVSLVDWRGSPNPLNLRVYCEHHDPMKGQRFHGPAEVATLWGERR